MRCCKKLDFSPEVVSQKMQRSLFQQAVRMHGQNLSVLTEKHLQEDFIFMQGENEDEQLADQKAGEDNHRESALNHPDTTAGAPHQDSVRLTGTMRDLVHVQSRSTTAESSAEESSKSDTSPEILPLGVPRELHEPFDDLSTKTKLFKDDGFVSQLHNFISKKAHLLFKASQGAKESATLPSLQDTVDLDYYATLPPMEQFMVIPPDQSRKRLFEILAVGDIIAGSIVAIKDFGMFVQVVCLCGKDARYLQECDIVGLLPKGELGDRYSQKSQLDDFRAGDVVRCRVVKTDAVNEKVILTMINQGEQNDENLLGIINEGELPVHYRRSQTQRETQESYDEMLDNTLGFDNPYNVSCLANMLDIDDTAPPSLMPGLQSANFPTEEYAESLRKWQSHKWAMESVARGVEHFKASRYLEAMQQLNRALEIDAENVEGLVARGALFANQNNLSKAIKDFAEALRIKPSHKNANRYMCQTLYEKGKQCEDNDEKDKAKDCYQSAVDLNPDFKDALVCLQRLEKTSRRKSVKDNSEEEGLVTSSEESPQEQISAKQLREMITEEKSSTKKKKKKDKQSRGHEDGKGDTKVKKELKMAKKKKKKKKLRRRSSSSPEISKLKQKEPSSDSESESSEPPSPVPKHKRGSKELKEVQSPERGRLTGKKRSRNGSLSPKRKSRSKTRKADLIRKKSKHASETSSSNDDDKLKEVEVTDKRNHRKSMERNSSVKAKHKVDLNRSRKDSDSSVASSSDEEPLKKREGKKERKDQKVKESSHKKRKMKTKKDKIKRSRSSSSVSEESADSPSYSPMRKKSKPAKKAKKMHKRSKKRSDSVTSGSDSGSESERKPSPPRKAHKKKKKNKKKKAKKKERASSVSSRSVLSSESPERPKSTEEHSKKRKFKKNTKGDDHYSDRSSLESSSSSEQQKVTNMKKDSKARIDGDSPIRSERRSRSTSLVKKASKGSSDEGEEIKIGKKRSRSSEYSIPQVKDHPKRQSSREAGHSPTDERRQRMTSDEESEEHYMKKAGHKGQKRLSSPEKEESKSDMKVKTESKQKIERKEEVDKSSRRSKRHSKAESPSSNRKHRSASRERNKSDDRDKKKSRKSSSPAGMSPERKEPSEDYKQGKLDKHSEFGGDGSSREKNKFDKKDKKRQQKSYSSASESPPRKGKVEEHKEEKSGKHSRTREDSHERLKLTRRSRSLSPKGKREEEKKERTPIRERKRKRSGSFKDDTNSLEMDSRDRKSRDIEKEDKVRHRKESGETRSRLESPEGSRYRPKSADSGKNARKESPKENKKSQSKRSPSPFGRNEDRSRSREDVNQKRYSRSGRSTSVDFHDRKQRSKSGSYEREKDKEHNRSEDKDRGRNRRESREKEDSRRRSGSFDREGPTKERKLSDGDHHKNSDETNNKDRPRSREDEKRKESRDAERRTSHDVIRDDRDRGRDRRKESQYHDLDRSSRRESRDREGRDSGKNADSFGENGRKSRERSRERKDSRKNADSSQEIRRKSREREGERSRERSREKDRRDSAKNVDNSRERKERSSEREKEISGSRFESNRREQKIHSDSSKDIGKAGTKAKEGEHHQMPSLNIEDIPMPPEKPTPVVEDKKEPSPILYVTSSSCKDEIIKVKSKWDTDSEDDESGASGPSQNRRGGGGRGAAGGPKSFGPSSQYRGSNVGGNTGGGKNYGGYRRHADDSVFENTSYNIGISETCQCCQHLSVDLEQAVHHEPLRLRGGCVASPPPKYESDHSDSDVSFSSSSNVDSEEPKQDSSYEDHSSVGRRYKSSSSDRSSGERSKKRFKLSRRRESQSSSRSSSTSSSGSWSSRSSSRSDISLSPSDKSRSPSSERSSSSYRSYGSNSKSSKEQIETRRQDDQGSNTESSDSECADEYNLFDSWEDYMDTKGHNLGKELHSSIREQRTVKLETGGSTVGKFNRNSPVHTDSEEEQESPSKTVQTESPDDDNAKCDEDITDNTKCENEQKTCGDLGENKESGTLEKAQGMKNQAPILNKEVQLDRHSRKRDRDHFASSSKQEANKISHYQGSSTSSRYGQYGFGADNVRQENYSHNENLDESYPVEYGNQLKVRLSHGSDRHDHVNTERRHGGQWSHDHRSGHYKDERQHRGDGNYRENHHHSRHTYPQREERQDYRRHSQRGYGNHRRREHGFRRRRDDDDWGRGVKEVQERGTFLGLVTKSKEGLVSQLYSVCSSALELVRSDHRQWWL
ncbi:zinc finger CCCH domain-containing protein 13-like isoform X1 [Lytechinus variegatus]|uniref:zinc finger CCCH domain-containing protein 13-like isoform X1 n=1 Tax=Lytechinus variegatus TaxID=7654 RepID=UPI001BB2B27E|nr:zinc finger CCCH domain-containing protein 13-like isoform X1 [Lytechinus variegatus]